ncbi:MAG: hypothetical protein IIA88_08590 [Bacteroidetes bacterium]|nr:hypothetical protein [Bacteroidota bacterium]
MKKENIDRKLTAEIELFKTFSWYLIGLTTGIASLLLTESDVLIDFVDNIHISYRDEIVLWLMIIAIVFFIFVVFLLLRTYFRINRLKKL